MSSALSADPRDGSLRPQVRRAIRPSADASTSGGASHRPAARCARCLAPTPGVALGSKARRFTSAASTSLRQAHYTEGGPPGIDLRSTREAPRARSEFRVGVRGGHHVGQLRGRPSRAAARSCRATSGRWHSQFSEAFEGGPGAGPPPEGLLPTLP